MHRLHFEPPGPVLLHFKGSAGSYGSCKRRCHLGHFQSFNINTAPDLFLLSCFQNVPPATYGSTSGVGTHDMNSISTMLSTLKSSNTHVFTT